MVPKLVWDFMPSNLTSDSWSKWSCILANIINYLTRSDIYLFSQKNSKPIDWIRHPKVGVSDTLIYDFKHFLATKKQQNKKNCNNGIHRLLIHSSLVFLLTQSQSTQTCKKSHNLRKWEFLVWGISAKNPVNLSRH